MAEQPRRPRPGSSGAPAPREREPAPRPAPMRGDDEETAFDGRSTLPGSATMRWTSDSGPLPAPPPLAPPRPAAPLMVDDAQWSATTVGPTPPPPGMAPMPMAPMPMPPAVLAPQASTLHGTGALPLGAAGPAAGATPVGASLTSAFAAISAGPTRSMAASLPPDAVATEVTVYKLDKQTSLDPRLVLVREPDSARAAAYRVLRHRLLERPRRTFVVTSPGPNEGKTTCAVNLALALGECGRARVLLIEGNLRRPSLGRLLGFMPPVCFAEQLAAHRDRPLDPWVLVEVLSPYLHVAAVKPTNGGRPLLDAPAFAIAMERLKLAGYDYIVVDAPPVLGAADVNLIQDSADAVVFVARGRSTSGRHLRRAIEQLAPAPILGVVLIE